MPNLQGTIGGRYELLALLGKGGMGVVYRARDLHLNEEIALKLLQPTHMGDATDVDRLKREIITARKITHPNVIRIHDFGLDGEEGFVSMEVLPGGALNQRLASGLLPIAEAVEISIGICDGLAAAHHKGIIHRDLKPHNVLFDAEGRPKLVDFGLARIANATSQTMGFSGTPLYMSPEMTDGREITTRSDIYSLGVLLFETFTGRVPFKGDTLMRLAMMHAKDAPPVPSSIRSGLPPAIDAILLKALEKEPERRFVNAKEMGDALREFQRTGAAGSITMPMAAPFLPAPAPAPAAPAVLPAAAPSSRRRAVLGIAAVVVLMVGGVASVRYGALTPDVASPAPTTVAVASPPPSTSPAETPAPTVATPVAAPPSPAATPKKTPKVAATPKATVARAATPAPIPIATVVAIAPNGKTGYLTVKSALGPAEIVIDGRLTGNEKKFRDEPIAAGRHIVVMKNAAGVRLERTVLVPEGKHVVVRGDFRAQKIEEITE